MSDREPPMWLPPREADSHKGTFGRVLLVGGSRGTSGAIAMSAIAALKTGAGLVTAAVPDRCLETVASFHPGIMTVPLDDVGVGRFSERAAAQLSGIVGDLLKGGRSPTGKNVIGCGPGMTTEFGAQGIVARVLNARVPRVLDADALNCLSMMGFGKDTVQRTGSDSLADDRWPLVLTPHPGELSRLVGVSASDRDGQIAAAMNLARRTGTVVVVKGGPTVVVDGTTQWQNSTGNPGMSTAGSGDVLTGVITSLLGQGHSGLDAAKLGVWVHGKAGDLAAQQQGQAGLTALEILSCLPRAIEMVSR